ncbi:TRAF3-interacting protein 1 [Lates calcarifer]|uniref:TRAF3-interacting protein 1 n=1 Tax=Lates calcarifer TaxID=8187 RepID=A0AAJ7PSY7_LATCA|nr:TRAF3-interacting protein 1 isoform X2 [Lates calcarifer]XP_018542384.2 TRAF3-interacting protein 1 [Lates calcarifer]
MNAAVVKKTQDTLGKVIKKPPLTEKLLSKPPFRYLHDIFSEVIRTTGFMKGLYGENEMKSDNVKDKDSKIAFLQKAIDVVMLVSGEPLAAKPARIVAGHEPEKTNELLQVIAKCCLNKMPSDDAVKRVLAGEKVDMKTKASTSRSQDKENRGRERHLDREEKKKITERSGSRDQKDPDQPKEQESRHRDGEKEHHRDRERSDKHHRSEQDRGKDRDKDKSRDRERDKDRDKGRVKDRDKEKDRERDREREKDKEKDKDREKTRERDSHRDRERDKDKRRDRDKEREKERERHKEGEERNKTVENGNSKARVSEEPQQTSSPDEPSKTAKPVPATDSPARIPRPSSAKGQRRRPKIGGQDESDSEGDGDAQSAQKPVPQENGDAAGSSGPSDVASSNRRFARPSSARPAPPRVKRQESYTDVNSERLSSAKPSAPVIMDGKKLSEDEEDEDEQFLVEEAVPPPPDAPEMEVDPAQGLDSEEKHGGLVKKILETKKDYELSPSSPKSKEQNSVSEAARKKERDMVRREIERLRSSIQTVCRSSLPLGKIMDYIQEDMDAMQAELHTWRRENKEHAQALLQEQRATDRAVEPLKAELAELEQLIKDQQDKICAVRSNILKNEEKIQKMVTGINFSSRT